MRMPQGAPSLSQKILPQWNLPRRGCHEEHQFREPSLSGLAQCLCEKAQWGNEGPAASCVLLRLCRVFPRSGSKTTGSERFLEMQTGLPERFRNVSKSAGPSGDGVSTLRGVQLIGCPVVQAWDVKGTK